MKTIKMLLTIVVLASLFSSGCAKKVKTKGQKELKETKKIITFNDIYNQLSPQEKTQFIEEEEEVRFSLIKSRIYEEMGLQIEALNVLQDTLKKLKFDYNKINLIREIGRIHQIRQEYDKSLIVYEDALKLNLDNYSKVDLYYNIAVIHTMKRDYKNAIKYYKRITSEMEDYNSLIRAMYGLTGIYNLQNNKKALIETYEKTIEKLKKLEEVKRNPMILSNVYQNLYFTYKQNGDLEKAKNYLTLAINNLSENNKDMYYWNLKKLMVEILISCKELDSAINVYKELQQMPPENINILINVTKMLGENLEESKRYEDAYSIYNSLLEIIPQETDKETIKFLIANNLILQKKNKDAINAFNELIITTKDHSKIQNAQFILAGIYELENNIDKAKALYAEISKSDNFDLSYCAKKRFEKLSK